MVTRWLAASLSIFLLMNCKLNIIVQRSRVKLVFIHCSLAILVKIMMCLAIFFSYALQFYVPVEVLNPFIQRRYDNEVFLV